jgi:hypothetical protein
MNETKASSRPVDDTRQLARVANYVMEQMPEQPPKQYNAELPFSQGQHLSLVKTVATQFMYQDWWLILVYVVVCIVSAYVTSNLSGALSFCLSILFSAIATWIGYLAFVKVIQITKEVSAPSQ